MLVFVLSCSNLFEPPLQHNGKALLYGIKESNMFGDLGLLSCSITHTPSGQPPKAEDMKHDDDGHHPPEDRRKVTSRKRRVPITHTHTEL